jgi:hypothetical protein
VGLRGSSHSELVGGLGEGELEGGVEEVAEGAVEEGVGANG